MSNLILITPVKDSLNTLKKAVHSLRSKPSDIPYYIFDDYSSEETCKWLSQNAKKYNYNVIQLKELTDTPSPNYRTILVTAQEIALKKSAALAIIESDVITDNNTLQKLNTLSKNLDMAGMVGAITVDQSGHINFPYKYVKDYMPDIFISKKSLSFCCTIITSMLLKSFDFKKLANDKHWFDVHISKRSRQLGFKNYIIKKHPVLHLPHSSRPWKQLKYKNPVLYYWKKLLFGKDKI